MKRTIIAAALLASSVFAIGYAAGQIRGVGVSAAASTTTVPPHPFAGGWREHRSGGFTNLGPRADGMVTAVNGNTVTVKADSDVGQTGEYGNVTSIVLDSSTKYNAGFHDAGTTGKSAITVGSYIVALGKLSSDGKTLTAAQVMVHGDYHGVRDHTNGQAPAFFWHGDKNHSGPSV